MKSVIKVTSAVKMTKTIYKNDQPKPPQHAVNTKKNNYLVELRLHTSQLSKQRLYVNGEVT